MSAKPSSKWRCPECRSKRVQVSLPTWYKETTDGALEFVETDEEADVMYWHCEAGNHSGSGEPDRVPG